MEDFNHPEEFSEPWNPSQPVALALTEQGQQTSWARGSRHSPPGCSFETTGLIMRMLPGVQAVTFCLEPDARNGDWPHRPRPLRQLPEMPCPPKVSLKNRQEWGQTVSGYVYSLLETALPLLKHADGLQDLVCQYLWSELSVPLNLQNLQTTCFFRCEMSGSTLRNILAWSSNLESFLWIPGWRGCWPHQATAAIRPARERLQTLVLDFSSLTDTIDGDGPDSENPQSTPQIGSLQEFTALTSLYADTTCVYHPALVM